ncbi:MAG: PspC domain-containing protein [Bacteroidota bacterium]
MYTKRHLENHLDMSSPMSDEAFEDLRSKYENENAPGSSGSGKFARIAGLLILLVAGVFILQRFFFPVGPDLASIVRMIPFTGGFLVAIIGLGLLSRMRSRSYKYSGNTSGSANHEQHSADPEQVSTGPEQSYGESRGKQREVNNEEARARGTERTDRAGRPEKEQEGEPYAFRMHRRWYRSREEKMLFGVCGGIAERLEVDPTIVRALFALAFLSYGFSFVIYILLAVILPKKPLPSLI